MKTNRIIGRWFEGKLLGTLVFILKRYKGNLYRLKAQVGWEEPISRHRLLRDYQPYKYPVKTKWGY